MQKELLLKAFKLMCQARIMARTYDDNRDITKYVHSTSRGHEGIQLATGLQLEAQDYVYPYYRDESMLLAIGLTPYELMLQLLAKKDDPFTGGRSYYGHPALKREGFPTIPHQSSATGMQAIPATGAAQAIKYLQGRKLMPKEKNPIVLCSLGDGCVTEGEVSEAFQFAVLHQLPILFLVQDNDWAISATGAEMRAMDAYEYAAGFKGMKRARTDGNDFVKSYKDMGSAINWVRKNRKPMLVHANCVLLGHHTSGVRDEWYRDDLKEDEKLDTFPILENYLQDLAVTRKELDRIIADTRIHITDAFEKAKQAEEPTDFDSHVFAPTPITEEKGTRAPEGKEPIMMVDAALFAVREIFEKNQKALLYGQDVGIRLGGVFREAATLAAMYGEDRVFNTPIQEAYIMGSTAGMSAVGCKPIVEIQFADYIWPAVNQLVTELSKSCYITKGKFPIQSLIRVPTGAYGGGGPYHSGTVESSLLPLKGIKIVYPSNAADMKGLMKAAFHDPNPVVMFEHKGLYWSKVKGTELAKQPEPSEDYVIPLGKANVFKYADKDKVAMGESVTVITYGMGVHWALAAEKNLKGQIEILDLRTLAPCDDKAIYEQVRKHNKVLVLTEETMTNSFAESIAGRINKHCFESLDAPVEIVGSKDLPAVPLNIALEKMMLPNAELVEKALRGLLEY